MQLLFEFARAREDHNRRTHDRAGHDNMCIPILADRDSDKIPIEILAPDVQDFELDDQSCIDFEFKLKLYTSLSILYRLPTAYVRTMHDQD